MPRRAAIKPRKLAHQERSRATVDAILRAAARILVKDGYEGASTNRIALVAGVSVGSLYQYFPNKEAIVAALVDQHIDGIMDYLRRSALVALDQPLEPAARTLIEGLIAAHRFAPELHRVFVEELPRVRDFDRIHQLEQETLALVRTYLQARVPEVAKHRNLDIVCFVIVHAVEALTHGAVLFRKDLLSDPSFVDEAVRLVVSYVR